MRIRAIKSQTIKIPRAETVMVRLAGDPFESDPEYRTSPKKEWSLREAIEAERKRERDRITPILLRNILGFKEHQSESQP